MISAFKEFFFLVLGSNLFYDIHLFIYISSGSQKPIQMICLYIPMTQIALIIPIRSSIMGNSLENAKYYFMKFFDFDIYYYFLYWNFDN
jgi:hypothetical protein